MPGAVGLWYRSILNEEIEWLRYAPETFMRSAVDYVRYSMHAGVRIADQPKELCAMARALWALALPIGISTYLRDAR